MKRTNHHTRTTAGRDACGISAKPFVANTSRMADAIHNWETVFEATHSHAPKLRLGETHVPKEFLPEGEKTLPVVVKIGYARH